SLACVVEAFVAAMKWKEYYSMKFVERYLKSLWTWFCEPLLFSMIGAEMKFSYLEEEDVECLVLCVICALLVRTTIVFFISWGMKFDIKERLFVAISSLPKATVQASLAPIALQYTRSMFPGNREFERHSTLILAAVVLSIVITAPIGAFAINYSAPKLLHKNSSLFETEETDYGFSLVSSLLAKNKKEKVYGTLTENNNTTTATTTNC
ncbi:mitochondrial sodium/hydrogen exchanger 9B2-like protein, partial [Leptotrombidium deliense]